MNTLNMKKAGVQSLEKEITKIRFIQRTNNEWNKGEKASLRIFGQ